MCYYLLLVDISGTVPVPVPYRTVMYSSGKVHRKELATRRRHVTNASRAPITFPFFFLSPHHKEINCIWGANGSTERRCGCVADFNLLYGELAQGVLFFT